MTNADTSVPGALQIQKVIPATPDRVFQAWTQPAALQAWWGPRNIQCVSAQIDLQIGGHYRIANALESGQILWISGVFEEIDAPHRLVYSWVINDGIADTQRVSVGFEAHPQGTLVCLKHTLIPGIEQQQDHQRGWAGCLQGLLEYFERNPERNPERGPDQGLERDSNRNLKADDKRM